MILLDFSSDSVAESYLASAIRTYKLILEARAEKENKPFWFPPKLDQLAQALGGADPTEADGSRRKPTLIDPPAEPAASVDRMVTVQQLADALELDPETIRRRIKAGTIEAIKLGRWRIPRAEYERLTFTKEKP